ncbi:hypothetical protein BamMC406_2069 [Burkholderia ambifaria MC40-6]|uniref:Uncharacterized protein n=1 Tax=Burkholderia ambifaria (strain MC40-6) TaxID=398577 RepID=B1YT61_BURA4|nr:hypothetical protein BamMC406_2069 [Burkholderia ambifaria MC40-6]
MFVIGGATVTRLAGWPDLRRRLAGLFYGFTF